MGDDLRLSPSGLHRAYGQRFDPARLAWVPDPAAPCPGRAVTAEEAAAWALREAGAPRLPVAIIGPREASPAVLAAAAEAGRRLGGLGFPLLCGGRGGAMAAASAGCAEAGGLMIGLLPGDDWREANPHLTVPIATGIGEARNALIATAAFALVAVGGAEEPFSYGTLTEMGFALRLGRLVLALPLAPQVPGARACASIEEAVRLVARRYLGLE
ncbi:MAG: DNA-binding protein [Rhodovarius sp.]|nr:DNA-binding protein [Rhodovarius sp.]MDW8314182.1 DNA-binding protein [Rhodovarius sp.]